VLKYLKQKAKRKLKSVNRPLIFKQPSEYVVQSMFFTWLYYKHPNIWDVTFSIPNGAVLKSKWEAIKLLKSGLKPGVFDVFVSLPNKYYHGLYLEFKVNKNTLTPNQIKFSGSVQPMGYACYIVHSIDEAEKVLEGYINDRA